MTFKSCWGCKTKKPQEDFNKNRAAWDGLQNLCRSCSSTKAKEKRLDPQHGDILRKQSREQRNRQMQDDEKRERRNALARESRKRRYADPIKRERMNQLSKQGRQKMQSDPVKKREMRERDTELSRQRRSDPEVAKEENRKLKVRRLTDPVFKLKNLLRSRLYDAIKHGRKAGSAVRDAGCSFEVLKEHIESLFTEGMSWDNWGFGKDKWHIDHHMPLDAFDLENRQHFLLANHYLNLQPMWAFDNLSKSASVPTQYVL